MAILSNENITKITKLNPREFLNLVQNREISVLKYIWRIQYSLIGDISTCDLDEFIYQSFDMFAMYLFISPSVKYLGLLAMSKILKTHPKSVQSHKDLILDCLDDKDESIRLRALDLLYGMVSLLTPHMTKICIPH